MLLLECIAIALLLGAPWIAGAFRRWVLLPIRIHRHDTLPFESRSQPGGRERLTPEAREQFDQLLPQFRDEGYDEPVYFFAAPSRPGEDGTAVHAFLVNRRDRQMASVFASSHTSSSLRNFVVSVGCLFEDGSAFCTATRRGARLFPEDPRDDRLVANWIRDVHTLCEFHRRRLAASPRADLPRVLPPPSGEQDFLRGEWARARNRYFADRIVYHDPEAGVLRLTWRGAYLLTWRGYDLVRQWREDREGNRAYRAWRDLDMARYAPPVAPPPPPALPSDDEHAIAPAEPAPTQLRYEMVLAPGEIAEEHLPPDALAVRMGMPGKLHYLRGRWPALLWIAVLAAATVYWLYTLEGVRPRLRTAPPLEKVGQLLLPLATVFFLVFNTGKLALQVFAVSGMIVLTASPRGLTYRNVPFLTGRGVVARSNVRALLVLPYPDPARRDLHTLFLITHNGVRLPLLITPDRPRLESLRARIAQTMGIDPAAETAQATTLA
jgi:hypothetical protein